MILSEPITIASGHIAALSYSLKDGLVSSTVTVRSVLTPELAASLGCQEMLFLDDGTPKDGFAKLELDTCCEQYRAEFRCTDPEIKQGFTIEGQACDRFCVTRTDSNVFDIRFRLHHTTNLHGPLAFVEQTGAALIVVRLVPKQGQLFHTESDGERDRPDR